MYYPNTNIGAKSKMGIGVEPTPGVAVMPARLLDRLDGNLEMELTTIDRRAMRATTAPIGAVPGLANTTGSINVEPTPEGISEAMLAFMGLPDTSVRAVPGVPTNLSVVYSGTAGANHKNYKVVAGNAAGDGTASAQVVVSNIATLGGANHVELRWKPLLEATFYTVLVETVLDSGTFDKKIATVRQCIFWDFGATPLAYTAFAPTPLAAPGSPASAVVGVTGSTVRNYKILAFNYLGDGTLSTATGVTTSNATLTGSNRVDLTWNAVAGAAYYKVLTETTPGSGTFDRIVASGITNTSYSVVSNSTSAYTAEGMQIHVHKFSDNFDQKSVTLSERRGDIFFVQPGVKFGQLTVRADKTQTETISFGFDAQGLRQNVGFPNEASIGLDTAGFDLLAAFGPTQISVIIGGSYNNDCRTCEFTVNKNVGRRDTFDGQRGPSGHYVQNSQNTGTLSLYFSDLTQIERYFGQAEGQTVPFGATQTILYFPIYIVLTSARNSDGFMNQIIFEMPVATFTRVGQPVSGPDAIMQEVAFTSYNDPDLGTNARIWIVNTQDADYMSAVGTPIDNYPQDEVHPYFN